MDLILKFTDKSSSFTNGVEFGRLLQRMQQNDEAIDNCGFPVHIENIGVIKEACNQYGYVASFGEEHYGEWIEFIGIRKTGSEN